MPLQLNFQTVCSNIKYIFAAQKLMTCRSRIYWLDSIRLSSSYETKKNSDRYGLYIQDKYQQLLRES